MSSMITNIEEEILINNPEDIMGMGIKNILQFRIDDTAFKRLIINWNKTIEIEIRHLYGVKVSFQGNRIEITPNVHDSINKRKVEGEKLITRESRRGKDYDVKLIMDSLQTMVDISKGDLNPIIGVLKGRVKVKKIWNIPVILRFLKIFIPNLRIAGERAKKYDFE